MDIFGGEEPKIAFTFTLGWNIELTKKKKS